MQIGELNSTIEDSLLGQGVVKAFAAEDQEREKFAKGNQDFEQIKTLGYSMPWVPSTPPPACLTA